MGRPYIMKDLGYPRTPTTATMRVIMPDYSAWDVPVQAIVDSRDANYADEQEDTIGFIRKRSLDEYEIRDWAGNNMNWSDVSVFARKADVARPEVDWEEGWCNGKKEIIGSL